MQNLLKRALKSPHSVSVRLIQKAHLWWPLHYQAALGSSLKLTGEQIHSDLKTANTKYESKTWCSLSWKDGPFKGTSKMSLRPLPDRNLRELFEITKTLCSDLIKGQRWLMKCFPECCTLQFVPESFMNIIRWRIVALLFSQSSENTDLWKSSSLISERRSLQNESSAIVYSPCVV